jgi:site-specific DNA-methyltransferase (adenine-specific)
MIERDTELQNTTEPAIAYSACYRLPFLDLFHADCMDIMKQYPDKYFDLAIVDPPYGLGKKLAHAGNGKNTQSKFTIDFKSKNWDNEIPSNEYFEQLKRVSKNQIIWGGNYFPLPPTRCFICWDKMVYIPSMSRIEQAWTSFDKLPQLVQYNNNDSNRIHLTQKPVELYDYLIVKYAEPNQKILDTHFGSGSIALAVDKANRLDKMNLHLTACEIDKEYIDKAVKRISESIKQGTLSF